MPTIIEDMKSQFNVLKVEEQYFIKDQKNITYFALNPLNTDRQEILTKISAVNSKELNDIAGAQYMADQILKLNIDQRLQQNDLTVVEDIANITINGKKHRLMNFASVYCNYHKPEVYPIYSDQHTDFMVEYIKELKLNIDTNKLDDYLVRKEVIDDIISRFFADSHVNYFQARKFGWLYLDKFIEQARAKRRTS